MDNKTIWMKKERLTAAFSASSDLKCPTWQGGWPEGCIYNALCYKDVFREQQLRETLPVISHNQMRETPTSAHLISCFLTDGGSISFLRQIARAQKARKLGFLGSRPLSVHIFRAFEAPKLCNNSSLDCSWIYRSRIHSESGVVETANPETTEPGFWV